MIFITEVEYADGSITEKRHEIDLDLRDFDEFYTRYEIDYGQHTGGDTRQDVSFEHFDTLSELHSSSILDVPFHGQHPDDAELENIVLVHGWNMSTDWKEAFAETAFKRLYWQGFRGHLVEFDWPTFYDSEGPFQPFLGLPDSVTKLNQTYNPSEFQAYRSGLALQEVISGLDGDTHLLAHSMGNVVAAEALRLWAQENDTPLVANYVAMEAAISAGVYSDNAVDAFDLRYKGNTYPIPNSHSTHDLNRLWWQAFQAGAPYMEGAESAASTWINLYNPDDFATALAWRLNNLKKPFSNVEDPILLDSLAPWTFPPEAIWPYRYVIDHDELVDGVFRHQYFRLESTVDSGDLHVPQNEWVDITNGIHAIGNPNAIGPNTYEIMAFMSVANAETVGNVALPSVFNSNTDLNSLFGFTLAQPPTDGSAHSFQFNHDASLTWSFWDRLKTQTTFRSTHN